MLSARVLEVLRLAALVVDGAVRGAARRAVWAGDPQAMGQAAGKPEGTWRHALEATGRGTNT